MLSYGVLGKDMEIEDTKRNGAVYNHGALVMATHYVALSFCHEDNTEAHPP